MDLLFLSVVVYLFASGVVSVVALWTNYEQLWQREVESRVAGSMERTNS